MLLWLFLLCQAPLHGMHYWDRAQLVQMVWAFFWIIWMVIRTVKVHLWVICCDYWISSVMQFSLWSAGTGWRLMQGFLNWFVCWLRLWSAVVSRVTWRAPMVRWSVMWCVTVRVMWIGIWVWASWSAFVMASAVPLVWPGIASVGVMAASAMIPVRVGLWPRPAASVPVSVTVARGWSGVVPIMGFWSVVPCRCTWGCYPVQAIYYYVTIFITLKASNIQAVTCCVTWVFALKTANFIVRHNICCWGWYQCSCKLMHGFKLLNFRYSICESLWSLFLDSSS